MMALGVGVLEALQGRGWVQTPPQNESTVASSNITPKRAQPMVSELQILSFSPLPSNQNTESSLRVETSRAPLHTNLAGLFAFLLLLSQILGCFTPDTCSEGLSCLQCRGHSQICHLRGQDWFPPSRSSPHTHDGFVFVLSPAKPQDGFNLEVFSPRRKSMGSMLWCQTGCHSPQ